MFEHKYTDEELTKILECCIKAKTWGDCEELRCPASTKQGCYFYLRTDEDYENTIYVEMFKDVLDLIKRYKAEIEQLKHQYDLAVAEREANVKGFTAEVAELQSEIKVLKDSNINLQELYQTEREKVAKAKEKVFEIGRALQSARAEIEALKASKVSEVNFAYKVTKEKAIKEFAESIKLEFYREFDEIIPSIMADRIDNLVKEMTEGES